MSVCLAALPVEVVLRLRAQTIDSVNGGDAMRVIWLILGAARVGFGWVLFTIVLR
jgi:hypothetical protein